MSDPALRLAEVRRSFKQGGETLEVLRGIDLSIAKGEIVALVGPSGSGKSTMLQICGLLEKPSSGSVAIAGTEAGRLSDDKRTALRRSHLGFVYQYHHLLPEFSAVENVVIPQMIAGVSRGKAKERAMMLLDGMGLAKRASHRPAELSGGEQQRVAICRALANRPKLLLADEPTGNLDPHTSDHVFGGFLHLVREEGLAALIATHNPDLAARMDRTVRLNDGRLT
ncbi:ABC transporter ATP-binding protein [Caenispirillum bisanense]|uniref:Lipoprotein-releasing system ATP-binding protein n=1 Tax=Caenispirillum bisanense TaxID=414052 RepID=A0A286GGA1_9PROT|nr:ABC transporter ATP-binding protein [Caenispirillum bisanense]SOD94149.1 lipoprotein-releasing system ATP-binding protein [Caenispirillum bisanense]